jgi:hypothetical protein
LEKKGWRISNAVLMTEKNNAGALPQKVRKIGKRASSKLRLVYARGRSNHGSATAEQVDYKHDRRNHQQQVNKRAADAADQPQQPQYKKNSKDCPKHSFPPSQNMV